MIARLRLGIRQLLVAVDQLVYILITVPIYVAVGGPLPPADETILSRVGRAAIKGHRWGLVLEAMIDRLFVLLGSAPGHGRRNVETQFAGDAPTRRRPDRRPCRAAGLSPGDTR